MISFHYFVYFYVAAILAAYRCVVTGRRPALTAPSSPTCSSSAEHVESLYRSISARSKRYRRRAAVCTALVSLATLVTGLVTALVLYHRCGQDLTVLITAFAAFFISFCNASLTVRSLRTDERECAALMKLMCFIETVFSIMSGVLALILATQVMREIDPRTAFFLNASAVLQAFNCNQTCVVAAGFWRFEKELSATDLFLFAPPSPLSTTPPPPYTDTPSCPPPYTAGTYKAPGFKTAAAVLLPQCEKSEASLLDIEADELS